MAKLRNAVYSIVAIFAVSACHQVKRVDVNNQEKDGTKLLQKIPKTELQNVGKEPTYVVDQTQFASMKLGNGKGTAIAYHEPIGLEKEIVIDPFVGDIENIVYFIATQTGYTYLPHTGLKVSPVIVTYHSKYKTAFEALVEINNKVGRNAQIKISEPAKTIQIVYPVSARNFK